MYLFICRTRRRALSGDFVLQNIRGTIANSNEATKKRTKVEGRINYPQLWHTIKICNPWKYDIGMYILRIKIMRSLWTVNIHALANYAILPSNKPMRRSEWRGRLKSDWSASKKMLKGPAHSKNENLHFFSSRPN